MEQNMVIFCGECTKENKFEIPLCIWNKNLNEIEYKCRRHNKLNENNLFDIKITDKLKIQLKECQIHKNKIFCGWCDECNKNLCQICIGDELRKAHNYILYSSLFDENIEEEFVLKKIKMIKSLFEVIKNVYSYIDEYSYDIKSLENIIKCNEIIYNIYFKQKIVNYQTIINLKQNINDLNENYEKFKLLCDNIDNVFISFIKGKDINNLNTIKIPEIKNISKIIILNSEMYDEENNENNKYIEDNNLSNNNNKVFVLLIKEYNKLLIYNMNGFKINEITLNLNFKIFHEMIQYKSNILLLFYGSFISFLIFSNDFKEYEFTDEINIEEFIIKDNLLFSHSIPLFSLKSKNKIIKIDENTIVIFYLCKIYIIKLNKYLIFKDKRYYPYKNFINEINSTKNIELIKIIEDDFQEIKKFV